MVYEGISAQGKWETFYVRRVPGTEPKPEALRIMNMILRVHYLLEKKTHVKLEKKKTISYLLFFSANSVASFCCTINRNIIIANS